MQLQIYGKIVNKYPEHLASEHQILCSKYELHQAVKDIKGFEEQVEKMKKFERHGEEYSIICPKEKSDMIDEAKQQSNCLASYVPTVIQGECMIFFLRKTEDLLKSLVTIEIKKDYTLGQVKAKFNHAPGEKEMDYVNKWYKDKFLKLKEDTEWAAIDL